MIQLAIKAKLDEESKRNTNSIKAARVGQHYDFYHISDVYVKIFMLLLR